MPGVMFALLHGKSLPAGALTRTTTGAFVVPAYNTLTVECRGAQGASAGAYPGGLGGRAFKTYTNGSGGPAVGASITVTINSSGVAFGFGSPPTAYTGGAATDDVAGYEYTMGGDMYWQPPVPGSAGSPGGAINGDTNQTGVSSTAQCVLNWS